MQGNVHFELFVHIAGFENDARTGAGHHGNSSVKPVLTGQQPSKTKILSYRRNRRGNSTEKYDNAIVLEQQSPLCW